MKLIGLLAGRFALALCLPALAQLAMADELKQQGCGNGRVVVPSGQEASDIQFAIRKGGPGSTIVLSGDYQIDSTIELLDETTLCTIKGATLTWIAPERSGMMISALRVHRTTIRNLVLDGRGIMIKGNGHVIEGNLIRNIAGGSDAKKRWGERHGVFVVDQAKGASISGNMFMNIVDTGIMAYGLDQSTIADNKLQGVAEGIHLWSSKNTVIKKNVGQGFKAMSIEIQGDNHPGLVVENNSFKKWHKDFEKGAYAMSVVSGQSAIIRDNTIEGSPLMAAGLEVGGIAPSVTGNKLIDVNIMVTDAPDTVIKGNTLTRGSIVKDVNQVHRGTLTIQDNVLVDSPRVGIYADHWTGFEQVIISGNVISKQLLDNSSEFIGIQVVDFDKQPLVISKNQISVRAPTGRSTISAHRIACLGNSGYKGNLRGAQIVGNSCEGGGVAVFSSSNSLGGHNGVIYRDNRLQNLKDTIVGDSDGLQSNGNQLSNVANDQARLKDRRD